MDKLKRMFDIQLRINSHLKNLTIEQKQEQTKQFVLAATVELTELLSEINWNTWKKPISVIESNVIEEAVDTLKFLMNIFIIWGLDDEKLMDAFERKSMVVEQRFKQFKALEEIKKTGKKVCAIDIDGVMVPYPGHWVEYVNKHFGANYANLFEVKKNVKNEDYIDLRNKYNGDGENERLPLTAGALSFILELKKMGYSIVFLTKRPYKKFFRLFADTKNNFDKHGVPYDAIVFDSEKHKLIIKELPQLEFMVEDNRNIANEVASWSYTCFLIDNIYNQGDLHENVVRVHGFNDIIKHVERKSTSVSEMLNLQAKLQSP